MPYNFKLSTTSQLWFPDYLSSNTHPSLPQAASAIRGVFRQALKDHKHSKTSHLARVQSAIDEYVPYLLAIDAGLCGKEVAEEEVDVVLQTDLQVEWRSTLTTSLPGRETSRIKLRSFEYEVVFVLSNLALTNYLLARDQLRSLYDAQTPTPDQRTAIIAGAGKRLQEAHVIYVYLSERSSQLTQQPPIADVASSTLSALASLMMAEATLSVIYKDDPYPAVVAQDRNKSDKEWMYKAPEIKRVTARVSANTCLAAAGHAAQARGHLARSSKISESLAAYIADVQRTARGKACRFLGIDAEMSAKSGEAIAYLKGAKKELGFAGEDEVKTSKGFSKLKHSILERREDRKIEKGSDWGNDAGRLEEGRVVDMLLAKWTKQNDTVTYQTVPPYEPLLAKLPSGRDFYFPKPWTPPSLDARTLERLRAPPDPLSATEDNIDDDDSDFDDESAPVPGAYPGNELRPM